MEASKDKANAVPTVLYYMGIVLSSTNEKRYQYWNNDTSQYMRFKKAIVDVPVGVGIRMLSDGTTIWSPYEVLWNEAKHDNAAQWYAQNMANQTMLNAIRVKHQAPTLVAQFEKTLEKITEEMTLAQKRAFLMRYILNLKS